MTAQTLPQMRELLRLAQQLGFDDDIQHWKQQIAAAEEANRAS